MTKFFREIWELGYWAFFRPSKLKKRLNTWSPQKNRHTWFWDILFFSISWRFASQCFFLMILLNIPLVILLSINKTFLDWVLLAISFSSSYILMLVLFPLGLIVPLILLLAYGTNSVGLNQSLQAGVKVFSTDSLPTSQMFAGVLVGLLLMAFVNEFVNASTNKGNSGLNVYVYIFGSSFSFLIGTWLSTGSITLAMLCSFGMACFSYLLSLRLSFPNVNLEDLSFSSGISASALVSIIVSIPISVSVSNIVSSGLSDKWFSVIISSLFGITSGCFAGISAACITIYLAETFENENVPDRLVNKFIERFKSISVILLSFVVAVLVTIAIAPNVANRIPNKLARVFIGGLVSSLSGVLAHILISSSSSVDSSKAMLRTIQVGLFAIVAGGFVSGIASASMVGVVESFFALPLSTFCIVSALISFSCSYCLDGKLGWWIGLIIAGLGFENFGQSALLSLPVAIIFYYRIVPEYFLFSLISIVCFLRNPGKRQRGSWSSSSFNQWMQRLPPFSNEFLWFPLPRHERLLIRLFQIDRHLGLKVFQEMQVSSMPGLLSTVRAALPQIVADYLSTFWDASCFLQLTHEFVGSDSEKVLEILLPNFYSKPFDFEWAAQNYGKELSTVIPLLQDVSKNTSAALQPDNAALKRKGLQNVSQGIEISLSKLLTFDFRLQSIHRWESVLLHWRDIIEYELKQQRKLSKDEFWEELLNPFQYGNPLRRTNQATLFKGRKIFAERIVRILLDKSRPTIVLHGPRRCGKTSFLNNLPSLLPSQWIPVFIDAQSSATTTDEAAFCQTLVRAIIRDGQIQGVTWPQSPTRQNFLAAPYLTLENWLQDAFHELHTKGDEKRLLLAIDEFEKIGAALDTGKLSLALFDELRSLIQHWDQLGFVFSGVQTLEELGPNWSSYFISVVPVEMLYLKRDEASELLTDPAPSFALQYAPGLIDTILDLTQCHPNLLQLIGSALVTEANERHTDTATAEMLQSSIPRVFTLGGSYFNNVWKEFTGDMRKPAEVKEGQFILKALANGVQPASPDALGRAALRHMKRYHLIKQVRGQYEFDIPLIQRWVKERATLE